MPHGSPFVFGSREELSKLLAGKEVVISVPVKEEPDHDPRLDILARGSPIRVRLIGGGDDVQASTAGVDHLKTVKKIRVSMH